jgi:hypothetical protein
MQEGRLNPRLLSFCEIAVVVQHGTPTLDWTPFAQRVHHWGVAPYVYVSLRLARDLVRADVPEAVVTTLEPKGFDARLLDWARDELLEGADSSPLFPDLLRLWMGGWLTDRAAVLSRIWSPTVVAKSYGLSRSSARRYGYYPRRLKDLVRRHGPALWRLLRHDLDLIAQAEYKTHLAAWLKPFNRSPRGHRPHP